VRKYSVSNPTIDTMLNAILTYAQLGEFKEAEELKADVETMLRPVIQAWTDKVVSMPVPEKMKGDIFLGTVFQGDKDYQNFEVPLLAFTRHVAIFASAGHGKTVTIINLIKQIMDYNRKHPDNEINFLIFDFKQDFRHLIKELPIVCLRWNWLKLNPFVPPEGVSEIDWFNVVLSAFAHAFVFFQPSENYMREFVMAEYEKVRGSGYVHLQKVKEAIAGTVEKGYVQNYQAVVLNRLTTMTQVLHDVLDCEQGISIESLLDCPVVIELDMLEEGTASFIISLFLAYILVYRRTQKHRGGLKHLIIFDEAQKVFYKPSDFKSSDFSTMGPSIIDDVPRIIRDYDEGLIFSTQEPSKINDSVIANTDLKLVGYLGNEIDISAVERMYHLDREDSEIIVRLKLGQWMAHKSGIPYPFLLKTPDYPLTKTVSDEELKDAVKDFLGTIARSEPRKTGGTMLEYVTLPPLSNDAQTILKHIAENPIRSVMNRYRELNIHPKEGSMAVKELQEKKFIMIHSLQLSPGRPTGYLEPTELGKMWLSKNNVNLSAWNDYVGNVSLEHRVFQSNIGAVLKKLGYTVKREYSLKEKRFDIYAEHLTQASGYKMDGSVEWKADKRVGIEICISPRTDFIAAQRVASMLDEIIYVAKDQNVMMQMQREFVGLGISEPKFKFILGHRYLTDLHEQLSEKEGKMVAEA